MIAGNRGGHCVCKKMRVQGTMSNHSTPLREMELHSKDDGKPMLSICVTIMTCPIRSSSKASWTPTQIALSTFGKELRKRCIHNQKRGKISG